MVSGWRPCGHGQDDGALRDQPRTYFNYANRMVVLGVGVTTEGDILGLSPNQSDDPDKTQLIVSQAAASIQVSGESPRAKWRQGRHASVARPGGFEPQPPDP